MLQSTGKKGKHRDLTSSLTPGSPHSLTLTVHAASEATLGGIRFPFNQHLLNSSWVPKPAAWCWQANVRDPAEDPGTEQNPMSISRLRSLEPAGRGMQGGAGGEERGELGCPGGPGQCANAATPGALHRLGLTDAPPAVAARGTARRLWRL